MEDVDSKGIIFFVCFVLRARFCLLLLCQKQLSPLETHCGDDKSSGRKRKRRPSFRGTHDSNSGGSGIMVVLLLLLRLLRVVQVWWYCRMRLQLLLMMLVVVAAVVVFVVIVLVMVMNIDIPIFTYSSMPNSSV